MACQPELLYALVQDGLMAQPLAWSHTLWPEYKGTEVSSSRNPLALAMGSVKDKRILMFDKQGRTGTKMRVVSVNMEAIVGVTAETAGFSLDDSEITITFISTPNLISNNIQMENRKFEFPKSYNIQPLYKMLQEISYENFVSINNIHK